ncbi:hypothetical protein SJAG_03765 [Schizosaccharomyces japonicus yFS275]|uniref:Uncharacterized protein n=1 Tax=Schizosaccharomyces japonicus (strain yFS275 / FY16936) TaxID=402676 RepID=B6K502_SCHJY|nr:hypothetical protein SJAG_03765 [Schizosaccharomyces japonicus yFS275]EEB08606.1 hypothetical protein SJAG_03765 [Schizosaccharomyces japonicus yFS275]
MEQEFTFSLAEERLHVPRPDKYDGRMDLPTVEAWLRSMERYLVAHGVSERRCAWTAACYLTGFAEEWVCGNPEVYQQLKDGSVSWNTFKQSIRENFIPANAVRDVTCYVTMCYSGRVGRTKIRTTNTEETHPR